MADPGLARGEGRSAATLLRQAVLLVLLGTALGLAYNAAGRASSPQFGVAWFASDPFAKLPTLAAAELSASSPEPGSFSTNISDPMAIGAAPTIQANVPEVPQLDRPMQIQLEAAKQFFDGDAAWFVDARDEQDCRQERIAGAICLPYDEVAEDPARLDVLEDDGRPVIAYCGGGLCEVSLGVAWELIERGRSRVLVYMGGFDQWVQAGYPVQAGAGGSNR
jgi:rhodanese-related sulfurtransferase